MYAKTSGALLDQLVEWWIGTQHDFQISAGKLGKYFKKYVPDTYWEMYMRTYSDSDYDRMWDSMFTACDLFRVLGKDVAAACYYAYPTNDDKNMTEYMLRVRTEGYGTVQD